MGNQKSKILLVLTGVVIAGAAIFGFVVMSGDESNKTTRPASTSQVQAPITEVSYDGVEGKNALEVLKQTHKVETKAYEGLGELVISIDGVAADNKHFWAFYVGEQQSQVGAGVYVTKTSDKITWKLEEIK